MKQLQRYNLGVANWLYGKPEIVLLAAQTPGSVHVVIVVNLRLLRLGPCTRMWCAERTRLYRACRFRIWAFEKVSFSFICGFKKVHHVAGKACNYA